MTNKIIKVDQWLAMLKGNATSAKTTASTEAENLVVSMPGGFVVPIRFLDRVFAHARYRLPQLNQDRTYTVRKMLGKAFWDQLDDLEHRNAGRCISYLTLKGQLPLVEVDKGSDNHKRYVLK